MVRYNSLRFFLKICKLLASRIKSISEHKNKYIGTEQSCTAVIWIALPVEQIWGHYVDRLTQNYQSNHKIVYHEGSCIKNTSRLFLDGHIAKFIIYTMYILKIACAQKIVILNTGYDVALHDKYGNTYSQWTVDFILYCHIIVLYSFNSLIWLTGIVEVVPTWSRQPKLKHFKKITELIIMIMYHFWMLLTGSQININRLKSTPAL